MNLLKNNIKRDSKGRFVQGTESPSYWKGKKMKEETKIKISKSISKEKHWLWGKHHTEESKNKISINRKGKTIGTNNPFFGKHHSLETKNIISLKNRGHHHTRETKKRISLSLKENPNKGIFTKRRWENEEYKDKMIKLSLKGLMKRPTSFEQKISTLCFKHNLPFIYKGNGGFLINFKNPDFVNEKDKIVIEVFYSWFKIRDYGSVKNYKEFCRKKYNPAGWRVIFIDELDLSYDNWESICLNKINEVSRCHLY